MRLLAGHQHNFILSLAQCPALVIFQGGSFTQTNKIQQWNCLSSQKKTNYIIVLHSYLYAFLDQSTCSENQFLSKNAWGCRSCLWKFCNFVCLADFPVYCLNPGLPYQSGDLVNKQASCGNLLFLLFHSAQKCWQNG